ncbi:MAG: hypothetical protein DRO88_11895 [Promethearchaeia archaeon]|nr:MAG: hypothetical protein DRO88_11895 [Candidatus Lokiarchaeia archaeon]
MSLKTFLQNRSNANIYEMANNHMQKVLETVVEFERGFSIYVNEKDVALSTKIFKRVDRLENEADIIRRNILVQISKSELTTQMREDLSHLVKRIDRIANTTDGAARRLMGLNSGHIYILGDPILKNCEKIVHLSIEATKILYNLIKNLPSMDNKETFRICEKIQLMEHEIDVLHSHLYELLNKLPPLEFNAFVALQICNFIDMLETISDKVEDVSDYIEILKTAKRTAV